MDRAKQEKEVMEYLESYIKEYRSDLNETRHRIKQIANDIVILIMRRYDLKEK